MIDPRYPTDDPAQQLLVHSLIGLRVPEALEKACAIADSSSLDWNRVSTLAAEERIAPLLYRSTRNLNLLPGWLLESYHHDYLETALVNTLRLREVAGIVEALSHSGIDVIALKGLALAERIYGNIALRPMLDSDLLVRRNDAPQALAIVLGQGYQRELPDLAADLPLDFENEIFVWRAGQPEWHLELHWNLFDSPYYQHAVSEDLLWSSPRSIMIEEMKVSTLSRELQLLHLCGHLALHHGWQGLLWWNDIAALLDIESDRLEWEKLLQIASDIKLILPLRTALAELTTHWHAPVPPTVLQQLDALVPSESEVRHAQMRSGSPRSPGRRLLDDVSEMPTWSERVRFVGHNLFPSGDYMDARYGIKHPTLRPAYYVSRWLRGFRGLIAPKHAEPSQED